MFGKFQDLYRIKFCVAFVQLTTLGSYETMTWLNHNRYLMKLGFLGIRKTWLSLFASQYLWHLKIPRNQKVVVSLPRAPFSLPLKRGVASSVGIPRKGPQGINLKKLFAKKTYFKIQKSFEKIHSKNFSVFFLLQAIDLYISLDIT